MNTTHLATLVIQVRNDRITHFIMRAEAVLADITPRATVALLAIMLAMRFLMGEAAAQVVTTLLETVASQTSHSQK